MNAFEKFSTINKQRAERWHKGPLSTWSATDWSNALAGEVGELCNAVKKLRRLQMQMQQHDGDSPAPHDMSTALSKIKNEIGDVFTYLDLCAQFFEFDMFESVRDTFNSISIREGFPERIPSRIDEFDTIESVRLSTIFEMAKLINQDRSFRVHSNPATEHAIEEILRLAGEAQDSR